MAEKRKREQGSPRRKRLPGRFIREREGRRTKERVETWTLELILTTQVIKASRSAPAPLIKDSSNERPSAFIRPALDVN
jgi:hypothetical protein